MPSTNHSLQISNFQKILHGKDTDNEQTLNALQESLDMLLNAKTTCTENHNIPVGGIHISLINKTLSCTDLEDLIVKTQEQMNPYLNITTPIPETTTANNQTLSHSDLSIFKNNQISLAANVTTTIGLSGLTGALNGVGEVILHILERKNCTISTRRATAAFLAILNSLAIPTLPFIGLLIKKMDNAQNDSAVNSQQVWECIYGFTVSILPHLVKMTLHCVTPEKSILKNIFNLLSFSAMLWPLVNGKATVYASLTVISALLTSIIVSLATQVGLKKAYSSFFDTDREPTLHISVPLVTIIELNNRNNFENINENESHEASKSTDESAQPLLNNGSSHHSDPKSEYIHMNNITYDTPKNNQPIKETESTYITSDTHVNENNITSDTPKSKLDIKEPIYEDIINFNRPLPDLPDNKRRSQEKTNRSSISATSFFNKKNTPSTNEVVLSGFDIR